MPEALRWRAGDPVRVGPNNEGGICDFRRIEVLRHHRFDRFEFIGTDEDLARMAVRPGEEPPPRPPIGFEQLFIRKPDQGMQARMDELVANMDAYEAGTDRALAESGLKAAEEAYLAKSDEVLAAVYEMMEFEPETLDGCGAQMCALAYGAAMPKTSWTARTSLTTARISTSLGLWW
jgi:hypothetical protein